MPVHHSPFTVLLTGPAGSARAQSAVQIAESALRRGDDVIVLGGRSASPAYEHLVPYAETAFSLPEAVETLRRLCRRSKSRPLTLVLDEGLGLLPASVPPAPRGMESVLGDARALTATGHRLLLRALDRQRISLAAVSSDPRSVDPRIAALLDGMIDHSPSGGHLAVAA